MSNYASLLFTSCSVLFFLSFLSFIAHSREKTPCRLDSGEVSRFTQTKTCTESRKSSMNHLSASNKAFCMFRVNHPFYHDSCLVNCSTAIQWVVLKRLFNPFRWACISFKIYRETYFFIIVHGNRRFKVPRSSQWSQNMFFLVFEQCFQCELVKTAVFTFSLISMMGSQTTAKRCKTVNKLSPTTRNKCFSIDGQHPDLA